MNSVVSERHTANTATGGHPPTPTRTPGTPAAINEQDWQRTMKGLHRISLLLSAALTALIARMILGGPKLLACLTAALVLALLLLSLHLRQQGRRLQPGASSEPGPRNAS